MNEENAQDQDLLRRYVDGSEGAFRELVRRHLGMVHGTARRMLSFAPHLADDVTQNVFTDLARKTSTLSNDVILAGWLYRHSYYLALNAARAEHRRANRERTAMEMNAVNGNENPDARWQLLAPVLDDALNRLNADDRDVIVLRYLEQRDFRTIGVALGSSEDTVQKRASRALEKLRVLFAGRGIALSSALLASTLDSGAKATAPSSMLLASIPNIALSHATKAALARQPSTYLKMMTTSKKFIVGLAAVLILTGITMPLLTEHKPLVASGAKNNTTVIPIVSTQASSVETPKLAPAHLINSAARLDDGSSVTWSKLEKIVVPNTNIDLPTPLNEVAQTLHAFSVAYDPDNKGVKFTMAIKNDLPPKIMLKNQKGASLLDLLDAACKSAGYSYRVEGDEVLLQPAGPS